MTGLILAIALMDIGYSEPLANHIAIRCESSKNPEGCRKFGGAIAIQETHICTTAQQKTNNCWGMKGHVFNTVEEAFSHWADTYDRFWYKHKTPEDFVYKSQYTKTQKNEWIQNVKKLIKKIK